MINVFIDEGQDTYPNTSYSSEQQKSVAIVRNLFDMLLFEMETFSVTTTNQSAIGDIITRIKRENVAMNRNNSNTNVKEFITHLTQKGHKQNVLDGIDMTYKILKQTFEINSRNNIRHEMTYYENDYLNNHSKPMLAKREMVVPLIDADMEIFYNNLSAREAHAKSFT